MNFQKACEILEIEDYSICTNAKLLKKKYTTMALRYHPDKNSNESAVTRFQYSKNAYDFLLENYVNNKFSASEYKEPLQYNTDIPSYVSLFRLFLGTIEDHISVRCLDEVTEKLICVCEKQAEQMIDTIEETKFNMIYKLLTKYKHIFSFSSNFYSSMEKRKIYLFNQRRLNQKRQDTCDNNKCTIDINNNKTYEKMYDFEWDIHYQKEIELHDKESDPLLDKSNTLTLKPSFDDLWSNNVYQYTNNNKTLFIPLWHHELIYDISGTDLFVEIKPKMPSNYWIDENNNIHKSQDYTISELWDGIVHEKGINVYFGKKRFVFYPYELHMKTHQTWTWKKQGIPEIQDESIFDISRKCDLILHINITNIH